MNPDLVINFVDAVELTLGAILVLGATLLGIIMAQHVLQLSRRIRRSTGWPAPSRAAQLDGATRLDPGLTPAKA